MRTIRSTLIAVAFVLAPTAAKPATIVETFAVPLPLNAPIFLNFGIQLLSPTNFQQFNPALGTLNDVQLTLTGSFSWFPELDTPTHTLLVTNRLQAFTISQSFLAFPVTDDSVPVTLNLWEQPPIPQLLNFCNWNFNRERRGRFRIVQPLCPPRPTRRARSGKPTLNRRKQSPMSTPPQSAPCRSPPPGH